MAVPKQQNKPSQWLFIGAATILALLLMFYANEAFYQEHLSTINAVKDISFPHGNARIEIDFSTAVKNYKRIFESDFGRTTYPLSIALQGAAEEGKFTFSIKEGKITRIGGTSGAWKIYKNGTPTEIPVETLLIRPGDTYTLRVEK